MRLDLTRCRHRLSKLLLRRGIRFDDGRTWTERHRAWLATLAAMHVVTAAVCVVVFARRSPTSR